MGYNARIEGITPVYSKGTNFELFKGDFWDAMVDRGLDTIAHLPDAATQSTMHNVVENFPFFTLDNARSLVKMQLKQYDAYDHANDMCAKKLLYNSISKDLLVDLWIKKTDPFPMVWMMFIGIIMPCGITRFEALKTKIWSRFIHQYPGVNMTWFQQPSNPAATDKCYECGSKSTSTPSFNQGCPAG